MAYGGKEYNDYCNANYPQYAEQCQSARNMEDSLLSAFQQAGIPVRVTSSFRRPGAAGNAGSGSHHVSGNAIDLAPVGMSYEELEKRMVASEVIRSYFASNGIGLLNETTSGAMQSTGATGKHFHIGPDRKALSYWNALLNGIDGNTFNLESTPKSEAGVSVKYYEAIETEVCRKYTVNLEKTKMTYSYDYNGKHQSGPVNFYNAVEDCPNRDKYFAFCYDPNKSYHRVSNSYEFDHYINPFDGEAAFPSPGDGSVKQEAFIYYIYKKYGDQLSDETTRGGVAIAIRAYQQIIDGSASSEGKNLAYWQLANSWECSVNPSDPMCHVPSTAITNLDFGSLADTARSIYLDAKAVADTCTSSGCNGIDEVGVKWSPVEKVVCESEGGTLIKKIQGSVDGLSNYKGTYTYRGPICPQGLTCELRINSSVVSPSSTIPAGSKYEIWVKGPSQAFANAEGEVGIKITSNSKEDYHSILVLKSTTDPNSMQRFIAFLDNTSRKQDMDISITDISNVTCGKCGTDPMLTPGNPAFNKDMYISKCCDDPSADPAWCPIKKDVCVEASWNLVCGAGGDVYKIEEGKSQVTKKINYKDCIIDKKDPAENVYNILQNRYCTVSCKEDWEFIMPGDLGTHKAGTYMILAGSKEISNNPLNVKGSRTCVAGNGTNRNTLDNEILTRYKNGLGSFQADLEAIDNKIVKAINEYSEAAAYVYWFEVQSPGYTTVTEKYSCGGDTEASCGGNPLSTVTIEEKEGEESYQKKTLQGTVRYRKVKFTPEKSYDDNGKLGISEKNIEYEWSSNISSKCKNGTTCGYVLFKDNGDKCSTACGVEDKKDADEDYDIDGWKSKRDSAKSLYESLIAQRAEMIQDITDCNTWQNNFKFEPEISYIYQEHDYMNMLQGNNKFQKISGTGDVAPSVTIYRDRESKRDDYTRIDGNSGGSAFKQSNTNNIFTCPLKDNDKANGFVGDCKNDPQNMYYSSSILLKKDADAFYEIRGRWYTIHDSGSALYNPSEDKEEQLDEKTSLIGVQGVTPKGGDGKVLPISENTRPGDYTYELRFVDVGQYNENNQNNQTLGRLIGGDDNAHTGRKSVFAALKGYKNANTNGLLRGEFDQIYQCYYHIENKNPCVSKIKTEIVSLLDCPDGYRCSGYGNNSGYIDVTGDISFFVNHVSLNNLNPNNRTMGKNWTDEIGSQAKAAIEELGDEAYAKTPEYSFTIAPQGIVALNNIASSINYGGFELTCTNESTCTNPWLDSLKDIDGVTVNHLRD